MDMTTKIIGAVAAILESRQTDALSDIEYSVERVGTRIFTVKSSNAYYLKTTLLAVLAIEEVGLIEYKLNEGNLGAEFSIRVHAH